MPQSWQCLLCVHYRPDWTCDAFPDGIPDSIVGGLVDHREAFEGDHGVRWEPADAGAAAFAAGMDAEDDEALE